MSNMVTMVTNRNPEYNVKTTRIYIQAQKHIYTWQDFQLNRSHIVVIYYSLYIFSFLFRHINILTHMFHPIQKRSTAVEQNASYVKKARTKVNHACHMDSTHTTQDFTFYHSRTSKRYEKQKRCNFRANTCSVEETILRTETQIHEIIDIFKVVLL